MKETVKSKGKTDLPDGIYVGKVGGWELSILSQDYYGRNIPLEYGIKTMSLPVVVVVQSGIAYCYDKHISRSAIEKI